MKDPKSQALLLTAGAVTVATLDIVTNGGLGGTDLAMVFAGALPVVAFGTFVFSEAS